MGHGRRHEALGCIIEILLDKRPKNKVKIITQNGGRYMSDKPEYIQIAKST